MSEALSPSRARTSRETSSIDRTAILKVSFPFMRMKCSLFLTVSAVVGLSVPPARIVMNSAISPSVCSAVDRIPRGGSPAFTTAAPAPSAKITQVARSFQSRYFDSARR